jgi:hypothetical protein
MKCCFVLIIVLTCTQAVTSQYSRHIVQFKDKQNSPFIISAPAAYLSQASINRRIRQHLPIDSTDLPVTPAYIDSLRSVAGVEVINQSKWLNQALIRTTDSAALIRIRQFSFVKNAMAIALRAFPGEEVIQEKFKETISSLPDRSEISQRQQLLRASDTLSYGHMQPQIAIHNGQFLHNMNFTGRGMIIAVVDGGFFNYHTNPAIDSARLQNRILGTYDFVNNEISVSEDYPHGLQCLSIMAANIPGVMVGSAPHANYYLFRSEDSSSEFPVEEQNWVVAAETADSAGADLISSSLGYTVFQDPAFNHEYAERNGHSTIVTIGANFAVKKGMIVMNSAGNSGNDLTENKFISCPADGDSVVTVGAVDINGNIATFSSWGPNSAGQVKPDIVSVGQGTVLASNTGTPAAGNGTSYSTPNVAGLVACLWQAFPEFTNRDIISAVQKSSHLYANPDNRFGYGIPNFRKAYDQLLTERMLRTAATILGNEWIKAFPVPFDQTLTLLVKEVQGGKAYIQLLDASGRLVETRELTGSSGQSRLLQFNKSISLPQGIYFIRYRDGAQKATLKVIKSANK